MALTDGQLTYVEQRVSNDGPSAGVAWLLWIFLGFLGAHRFYLGRKLSGFLQLVATFFVIGLVWWLIDLFLLSGMIRQRREEIRQKLIEQVALIS